MFRIAWQRRSPWAVLSAAAFVVAALSLCHANAETPPLHKVGLLAWEPCDHLDFGSPTPEWEHFLKGMTALGYGKANGADLVCRSADRDPTKFDAAAKALLAEKVDVIVVSNTVAHAAVARHTNSVWLIARIFFAYGDSAVPLGLWSGVIDSSFILTGKRLELLRDTVSGLDRVGVLYRPDYSQRAHLRAAQRSARTLSIDLALYPVKSLSEVGSAFDRMAADGVQAVFLLPDPMIEEGIASIADLASRRALPTMGWDTRQVGRGLMMAYSSDIEREEERLAYYVDKLLRGVSINSEPVGQPSGFTLAIDLGRARSMGLTVPLAVLLFASEPTE